MLNKTNKKELKTRLNYYLSALVFFAAGNLIAVEKVIDKCPALPATNGSVILPAQKFPYFKGERTINVYIYYPKKTLSGVNATTGLFLTLHNWGGTKDYGAPAPTILADRYNTICIAVDYLQTGQQTAEPYDFGYLQSMDALRAMQYVWAALEAKEIAFSKHRIYCCGGSGGGNITQMVNKFAPRTFACIIDLSGMASLTDDMAYYLPGGSIINARYSQDPESPAYLEKHMQEIRDIGNPTHLALQKKMGNRTKIVVIHGVDDKYCLASDKKRVVANMKAAGLDVDAHFIEKKDIDGKLIGNSRHSIGNRTQLLIKFADKYLSEKSKDMRKITKPDFEFRNDEIKYETSNGHYLISYKNGYPISTFVPNNDYTPKQILPMIYSYKVENGAYPWYDMSKYHKNNRVIVNLPKSLAGETVAKQKSGGRGTRGLVLPKKVDAVTIGIYEKDLANFLKHCPAMKDANIEFGIQNSKGGVITKYKAVIYPNPKLVTNWGKLNLSGGIILLKMSAVEIKAEE